MKYTTMVTKAGNPSAKHHKIGSKYLPLGSKILATDNTKYYKEYKYRHINSTLCASLSMCVASEQHNESIENKIKNNKIKSVNMLDTGIEK